MGEYKNTEQLTSFEARDDGGYVQTFEQASSIFPIKHHSGDGFFAGYWIELRVRSFFQYETGIAATAYACTTGHPFDVSRFFGGALANGTDILESQGKVQGQNQKAFTIEEN
ncbi:MAG: hypothetical protein Q9218_002244 [Villophora microphyllina]